MTTAEAPLDIALVPNSIRPAEAIRCLVRMVRDPDDTENGARFVYALQGDRAEQLFQRFRADPRGARILSEERQLADRLEDRAALAALPGESLGRAYLRFVEREHISRKSLQAITARADPRYAELDPARRLVADRVRDLHDLFHVVTGYSRDLVGESLLLIFSYQQLGTRAFPFLIRLAWLANVVGVPGYGRLGREARRRGRDAPWLPVQDWEGMLERPLYEVRGALRLGDPPDYMQIRSEAAPAV